MVTVSSLAICGWTNDAFRISLCNTIQSKRYKRGLRSQEALGYAAGLHAMYIGAVKRGVRNSSLRDLRRIADALAMPLSGLISKA